MKVLKFFKVAEAEKFHNTSFKENETPIILYAGDDSRGAKFALFYLVDVEKVDEK